MRNEKILALLFCFIIFASASEQQVFGLGIFPGPQGPRGFNGTSTTFNSITCGAGTFISAYNNATHLATCTTPTNTAQIGNSGTHTSVFGSRINATQNNLKTLNAGTGITLSSNSSDITITASSGSGTVTGSQNVGKGTGSFGVLSSPSVTTIKGKNLTAGTGISLSGNTTDITLTSSIIQGFYNLLNIGHGGQGILKASGNTIQGKNITSTDSHLVVSSNTTDVNLSTSGLLSSAIITSQNTGKGTNSLGVLAAPTSSIVKAKNLTAGTNISLSGNTTDITISTSGLLSSALITSQNVGKGTGSSGVLASPTSSIVKGKNMTAGSGISISNNSTDITITNTGLLSGIVTSQNTGKGTGSFGFLASPTSSIIKSKNATAGTGISVSGNTTDITFTNAGVTSITGTSGNLSASSSTGPITLNTGNNLDYLGKFQTFTANKDFGGTAALDDFFANAGVTIRNPAASFATTIAGGAVTANRTLNLPAITGTDTLGALGFAQTWTAANTFTGNVDFGSNTQQDTFDNGGLVIRNPTASFGTTISGAAVSANRTLNLPLITATDTLAALGLSQSWTGNNDFGISGATDKFDGAGIIIRNPAHTFATTITNAAITANRTLNLPLLTQTETIAVTPQVNFTASSNKTGTTSLVQAGVMLGDGVTITPTVTGRISVTVSGYATQSTAADGCSIAIRTGTGGSPPNANAAVGTLVGNNVKATMSATTTKVPFSITIQKTGLTAGTKEWFELSERADTGGTCTLFNVMWAAEEI